MNSEPIDLREYPNKLSIESICVNIKLDIEPFSKSHYKITRNKKYKDYISNQLKQNYGALLDRGDYFGIRLLFCKHNRQRLDIDNLAKNILDIATGIIWVDDNQVHEIYAKLITDKTDSITILIHRIADDNGNSICIYCGNKFRRPRSTRGKGYCSYKCMQEAHRTVLTCKECGTKFSLPLSLARLRSGFCSSSCASKWWFKHSPKAPTPQTKCIDCGKQVSRREYIRCLHCRNEYRKLNAKGKYKSFQDFVQIIKLEEDAND